MRSSDKIIMGQFLQFAEILENKIRHQLKDELEKQWSNKTSNEEQKNDNNCKIKLSTTEQLDWSLMLGLKKQSQPIMQNPKKPAYKVPVKKPKPAHTLSETQQKSYQFFINSQCELPTGFTEKELRQAFRTLALKLHPDHGGTAFAFRELLEHRDILSAVLSL